MPFASDGDFRIFRGINMPEALVLESARLDACVQEVRRRPFYGIVATRPNGYEEPHVDCLADLPHLTLAWIWDIRLKDLSGLRALKRLTNLRLTDDHPKV